MKELLTNAAAGFVTVAALALAQPAYAAPGDGAANAASAGASAQIARSAQPQKEKKYCYFMEPTTGTRIPEHKCRTKAEWLAVGFDITKKK